MTTTTITTTTTTTTQKLIRIATVLGPAASLAATCGAVRYSDASLKQQIEPLDSPLRRLRTP